MEQTPTPPQNTQNEIGRGKLESFFSQEQMEDQNGQTVLKLSVPTRVDPSNPVTMPEYDLNDKTTVWLFD